MTRNGYEYRVRWLRVGGRVKTRVFQELRFARRFVALLGPEPWTALGKDPDALFCCKGRREDECACGGITWREHLLSKREGEWGIAALMFAEIQRRRVEEWTAAALSLPAVAPNVEKQRE